MDALVGADEVITVETDLRVVTIDDKRDRCILHIQSHGIADIDEVILQHFRGEPARRAQDKTTCIEPLAAVKTSGLLLQRPAAADLPTRSQSSLP